MPYPNLQEPAGQIENSASRMSTRSRLRTRQEFRPIDFGVLGSLDDVRYFALGRPDRSLFVLFRLLSKRLAF